MFDLRDFVPVGNIFSVRNIFSSVSSLKNTPQHYIHSHYKVLHEGLVVQQKCCPFHATLNLKCYVTLSPKYIAIEGIPKDWKKAFCSHI